MKPSIDELREIRNRKAVMMARHLFERFDEWHDDHKYAGQLRNIVHHVMEGVPFFDLFGVYDYQILELTAHEYGWKYHHNDNWAIAERTRKQRTDKCNRIYHEKHQKMMNRLMAT